jgi:hypothetical protein
VLPRDFRERLATLHDVHGGTRFAPVDGQRRRRARAGRKQRQA